VLHTPVRHKADHIVGHLLHVAYFSALLELNESPSATRSTRVILGPSIDRLHPPCEHLLMSTRHKPELDGIRGLAILGVLATHSSFYIQITTVTKPLMVLMLFGQWGVDLFFALSGFLITGILLETKTATNYLASFYARRVLRIWPVYYSVLLILFSAALVSPWIAAHMPVRREWLAYLIYLQNVPQFWANGYVISPTMLGHFWSLAVEEQFYFIWPFVVMFMPEGALLLLCATGLVVALPLRIYLLDHVFGMSWAAMIVTTARMDGLFVGAFCAILLYRFKKISLPFLVLTALCGVSIVAWIVAFHFRGEFFGSGRYMRTFGVTAVALLSGSLIALSQQHFGPVDRALRMRWLRFFGRYSYGIYVFHIPVFVLASHLVSERVGIPDAIGLVMPLPIFHAIFFILAVNATSILLAVVSFEAFESRILRLKNRFKPRYSEIPEQSTASEAGG
jgi:peptidoglycan/LPS O-acetylase OafA/YrhL